MCTIIDMGMSLRMPSLQTTKMNYGMIGSAISHPTPISLWQVVFLSPDEQPFDGPTVGLWAAGVIFFIMLTGLAADVGCRRVVFVVQHANMLATLPEMSPFLGGILSCRSYRHFCEKR